MNNLFEVYLLKNAITTDQWSTLYRAIRQYTGALSKFEIIFVCKDNLVRYFIRSGHNLSALPTKLDGVLLRPVVNTVLELPTEHRQHYY